MSRTNAREAVFQTVFQMEFQNDFEAPDIEKYLKEKNLGDQKEFAVNLIKTLCENKDAIDSKLNELSTKWPVKRMGKIDLAILRVAVCELMFCSGVPSKVAINEAVVLAKAYGSENSPKFVNGILANVIE